MRRTKPLTKWRVYPQVSEVFDSGSMQIDAYLVDPDDFLLQCAKTPQPPPFLRGLTHLGRPSAGESFVANVEAVQTPDELYHRELSMLTNS